MTAAQKLKLILDSPILWLETFCVIVDKNGKKVPFKLNPEQKELINGLDKYNIVLKSRQLGITSVSCGLSLYYALTQPNTSCLLISYSLDSAALIFDKLKQLYDDLPKAIKLRDVANNRTMLKFENNSKISVCTMGSKELARGSTVKFCHISEVAFCKQEVISKQILAIEQALIPDGKIILESTANGLNEFYSLWQKADNLESLYKPFFFSWVNDKIMFAAEYRQFAERYKTMTGSALTMDDLAPDEKALYKMGASLQQLTWRRVKIRNSSESQFRQEFPATPIEAFITSGTAMFNTEKIIERYNAAKSFKPIKGITGIPTELKVYNGNYLTVWDIPQIGKKYYIGVDASEGVGCDYNVITILDDDFMQVAEFRSNKTPPYEVASITYQLATWYNNALCVIEKASGGHIVLDRMRNMFHYHNLYKYKDYDQRGKMVKKIGFNTNPKTKPIIINNFVELFDEDAICIKSPALLNEMKTFEYTDGKMGAEQGKHDDCVLSMAFAIAGVKNGVRYI